MNKNLNLEQVIEIYNSKGMGQTFGELQASSEHRKGTAVRYTFAMLVDNWDTGKVLGEQPKWLQELVEDISNNKNLK